MNDGLREQSQIQKEAKQHYTTFSPSRRAGSLSFLATAALSELGSGSDRIQGRTRTETLSMSTVLDAVENPPMVLYLRPVLEMTDDQFYEFCRLNRDLRIERNAEGEIVIMAPAGSESSSRNGHLSMQLFAWAKADGTGVAFDSSGGFRLTNEATRSPDAAWVLRSRLSGISAERKKKFLPLCPDFVVELISPSDRLRLVQQKMQEYMANGARLGWLIDPEPRQVYIYRPGHAVQQLDKPDTVNASPELAGFILELADIWDPGL